MPQTKFQNIIYTIIMAIIMVYGMICYNVALNTGGVTNATFAMALHEMPIMVPIAIILEFFIVELWKNWPPSWRSPSCAPPTGPSSSPMPSPR